MHGEAKMKQTDPDTTPGNTRSKMDAPPAPVPPRRIFLAQWLIVFGMLLILGIIFIGDTIRDRTRNLTNAANQLSHSASSIAKTTEQRFAAINAALLDLRKSLPDYRNERNGDAQLAHHLNAIQKSAGLHSTLITNTQGIVTAASLEDLVGKEIMDQGYFQKIRLNPDPRTLYVPQPFEHSPGSWSLALGRATFDAQGRFSGIVMALLDPQDFRLMLETLSYRPEASASLAHGSMKILFSTSTRQFPTGTDISSAQYLTPRHLESGLEKNMFSEYSQVFNNERLTAIHTIKPEALSMDTPLVAIVSLDLDNILAPWHTMLRSHASLFVLLVIAATTGLLFYQNRLRSTLRLVDRHHEELLRSAERLALATEASHTGIWEFDTKTGNLIWDDTMLSLYGVARQDLTATHVDWQQHILPEDLQAVDQSIREAIENGAPIDTQFRIRRGDGEIRFIHAHARIHGATRERTHRVIGTNRDITEQRQTELALRESKDFAISVLDSMMEHVAVLDAEGTIVSVNQAWTHFAASNGGPVVPAESTGKNYLEVCAAAARNSCAEAAMIAAAIRGVIDRKLVNFDYEYDCHSPTAERWFNMHVTPLQGSRRGAVVVHEDITTRKQAENRLIQAQHLTQQFLDHMPGAAFVKDANLRILMASKAFQTMLGIDPTGMIGKSNSELYPGDFGRKLDAEDRAILESGEARIIEDEFDGRNFETSKFVIRDESGILQLGGTIVDVTDRKRHSLRQEAQLRLSTLEQTLTEKELLAHGLEVIKQLTGSRTGFLQIMAVDSETMELAAWTNGTLPESPTPGDEARSPETPEIWADCARTRETSVVNDFSHSQLPGNSPESTPTLRRYIAAPIVEDGRVRMILAVCNKATDYDELDATTVRLIGYDLWRIVRRTRAESALYKRMEELKALNRRLEEAQNQLLQSEKMAAIGQLAAGVAHELNNPISFVHSNLGSLSGYINDLISIVNAYSEIDNRLAASQPDNFDPVHQLKQSVDFEFIAHDIPNLLAESRDGLERVRKIVSDLKGFSRVGESEWQWADLHQGLESTLNIVWNEIKYKAELVREYGDLPKVYCIPSQINQVFMNLLTNAAHAIPEYGRIVLRSGRDSTTVWIEVEDNGSGIAPENLERIFDPFFTTKPVGTGTGLGLSLSWGIVKNHNGSLTVTSQPGQGTTFRLTLPVEHTLQSSNENPEAS